MPLYHVDVVEMTVENRRVLVSAPDEAAARAAAVAGGELTSEFLPGAPSSTRTAGAVAAYDGPRYIVEDIPDDPGYAHVIDTTTGDLVELHSSRSEAQDHADSLNLDEEDVEEAA